jgi:hypothetical protein
VHAPRTKVHIEDAAAMWVVNSVKTHQELTATMVVLSMYRVELIEAHGHWKEAL